MNSIEPPERGGLVLHLRSEGGSRKWELAPGEHLLGREMGLSIELDDAQVSRVHARLLVSGDGVELVDQGSKNGVEVKGQRLLGGVRLRDGQSFSIGNLKFEIQHPTTALERLIAERGAATLTRSASLEAPPRALTSSSLRGPLFGLAGFGLLALLLWIARG